MQPPPPPSNPEYDSIDTIFSGLDLTTNRNPPRKILPARRPQIPLIPCLAGEVQSSGGIDTIFSKIDLQSTGTEIGSPSMDKLTRLKDSVLGYLSPKRQRTTDPATPTAGSDNTPGFIQPASDSHISRQDLMGNVGQTHWSPSEQNQRRRARSEDGDEIVIASIEEDSIILNHEEEAGIHFDGEEEEEVEVGSEGFGGEQASGEEEEEGAELGSDAEQIECEDDEEEEEGVGLDSDGEEIEDEGDEEGGEEGKIKDDEGGSGSGSEFAEEEYPEEYVDFRAAAQAKVSAYLAQHHPLTEQKTSIARLQTEGDWHAEAMYVYERIQMRGYEPIIPLEWQMDFPNLPRDLFTSAEDNYSSCISDYNLWAGQSSRGHGKLP